ncbi:subunit of tubulin prefoldin [Orbilia oligospora]|uniref:Subunit of tubulin prefoldin n=1 Tax=Orbilia oligospora TaxID=2813651 RepID=A0A6G1LZF1_ORBOL|nr:subunit of tubulin prefoldin [Orbilia oligospora]KAF3199151.1 subunit of tubulin prefoldin [Orbilia oligospora]KAF3203338.1 subunit of tubulin prefoldin [Orbilia oligospora]KAF3216048.1 subunit of tubulin prefoldin [Orbilia oligospora]KAF3238754.1 subunit of tubulin prefoldin [Orbilia oligospora]
MSKAPASSPKQQTLDLSTLSIQNLSAVKKQLDEELEHLTASFQKLRAAQAKFKECVKAIQNGVNPGVEGKTILIPLTQSLYVPGKLEDPGNVLVDVGTGYYVEKTTEKAIAFYNDKIKTVGNNLDDLEKIITQKTQNVKVVEDVLRQKVLQANAATSTS